MRIVLAKGRVDGQVVGEVQVHVQAFGRTISFVAAAVIPTAFSKAFNFGADVKFIGSDRVAVGLQAFGVGGEVGVFWGLDASRAAVDYDPLGFDAEAEGAD